MTFSSAEVHKKESYHHGDLRQQLVNATRILVEEKGADGFSVAEAARGAGVSTAAPYRHFKDRTAMLEVVAVQGGERMVDAFDAATAEHARGSVEAITALGVAYVRFAVAEPGVFRLMFAAGEASDERTSTRNACHDRVLWQVAACFQAPEDNAEVLETCMLLWTFVHGASFLMIDGKMQNECEDMQLESLVRGAAERLLKVPAEPRPGTP